MARVHLPMPLECVQLVNDFLGFGIVSRVRGRRVVETTLCVSKGRASRGGVSFGAAIRCSLFCKDCCLSWASSCNDRGRTLQLLAMHDVFTDDAGGILAHRAVFDADKEEVDG